MQNRVFIVRPYLYVVDRRNDVIITGGYNVYPAEIERVLSAHPAVAMVAAGPVADAIKGELACAYVVLAPGAKATETDMMTYAAEHPAAYKDRACFVSSTISRKRRPARSCGANSSRHTAVDQGREEDLDGPPAHL